MSVDGGEGPPPLLDRVNGYLSKHKLSPRRFSLLATGHPNVVHRLQSGRKPGRRTIERIEALMAGPPVLLTHRNYSARRYGLQCSAAIRKDNAARLHRANDPCEQAALHLRKDGWLVCKASVQTPGAEGYIVGRMSLTDEEMLAMARKKGWAG